MNNIDSSWDFLNEFYESDRTIADTINKIICLYPKFSPINCKNFHSLYKGLISLLGYEPCLTNITYWDFLFEVTFNQNNSKDRGEEAETKFCNSFWEDIIKRTPIPSIPNDDDPRVPYLILELFDLDINLQWSLYGKNATYKLTPDHDKDKILRILSHLKSGFKKWHKVSSLFHTMPKPLIALYEKIASAFNLQNKRLSPLYPIMTFLIVLRREYTYSKKEEYLFSKKEIFTHDYNEDNFRLYSSLILGLYRKYENADPDILKYCQLLDYIEFHQTITKNIIENGHYKTLYNEISLDTENKIKSSLFKETEEYFNSSHTGKRLLIDYQFPHNHIGEEDIYIPKFYDYIDGIKRVEKEKYDNVLDYQEAVLRNIQELLPKDEFFFNNLLNLIYISFQEGSNYTKHYRNPLENELFDYIQIEKDNEDQVKIYRNHLKGGGDFIIVKSKEEREKEEKIREIFSNFRHDFKALLDDSEVNNLNVIFSELKELSSEVCKLSSELNSFLSCRDKDNREQKLSMLRHLLKELEDNNLFKKGKNYLSPVFSIIKKIRDIIEDDDDKDKIDLSNHITDLDKAIIQIYNEIIPKCINKAQNIKNTFSIIATYIKMAGNDPRNVELETINLKEELRRFIDSIPQRVEITLDCSSLPENCERVIYNKTIFIIILYSIVDNAIQHGNFKKYTNSPKIHIQLLDDGEEFLRLKICNNGEPINITLESYKTRGVFSGITGHTGIGGYQISLYAEKLGGRIEIYANKDWNTEIHLLIKKQL